MSGQVSSFQYDTRAHDPTLKQAGQSSRRINYLRDHPAKYRSRLYRIPAISYFVQTEGPALNSLKERRKSRYSHACSTNSAFFSCGTTSKASCVRAENLSICFA